MTNIFYLPYLFEISSGATAYILIVVRPHNVDILIFFLIIFLLDYLYVCSGHCYKFYLSVLEESYLV